MRKTKKRTETENTRELMLKVGQITGWDIVPIVGGMRQRAGLADRLIVGRGGPWLVEFKNPDTKLNQQQLLNIGKHRRLCKKAFVFRFLEEENWHRGRFEDERGGVIEVCEEPEDFIEFLRKQAYVEAFEYGEWYNGR